MTLPLRILLGFLILHVGYSVSSQDLPNTGLYSFELTKVSDDSISIGHATFLTSFNEGGYNNQPLLAADDLLYFSMRLEGDHQNDICALNLKDKVRFKITSTDESEYSPFLDGSGRYIYCVQTDLHDPPRQRLWKYPADRKDFGYSIWQTDEQVGYFTPLGPDQFAVLTVGEKHILHLVDVGKGQSHPVADHIGRCLRTDSEGELYFIHEQNDQLHYLKAFSPGLTQARILTRMPVKVQDFCLWDGKIWYGQDSQLKYFDPATGQHRQVAELSLYGISRISRLDIRNGTLVLVNEM